MSRIFATFLFLLTLLINNQIFAQAADNTIVITVNGSGKTIEDAKQFALRSAIEQAFGAFITGKTEMLNDKVIADQITSVSNGNIQSFNVLNEVQLTDGGWSTTIKATVSINKLLSFVNARGANAEVNGGLFTLNIKQQAFNEAGEVNAIYDMVGRVHELMQTAYDYKISAKEFESLDNENKNFKIPIHVTVTSNENMIVCADYLMRILNGVSLSKSEQETYINLKKRIYPVIIKFQDKSQTYYLRKELSATLIKSLFSNINYYIRNFTAYRDGVELEELNDANISIDPRRKYIDDLMELESKRIQYLGLPEDVLIFNLTNPGQIQSKIIWSEFKNIQEIEKIKEYTIKPRGVVSRFKEGGYLVYENNGHGLVVTLSSLGQADYKTAESICTELSLGGYNGFRLPDVKELEMVADNLVSKYINSAITKFKYDNKSENSRYGPAFWTSTSINITNKKGVIFFEGLGKKTEALLSTKVRFNHSEVNEYIKTDKINVLAVRTF